MIIISKEQYLAELRRMITPPSAQKLQDWPAEVCPGCRGELIHRGDLHGTPIYECLRCRRPYGQVGFIVPLDGGRPCPTPPPQPDPAVAMESTPERADPAPEAPESPAAIEPPAPAEQPTPSAGRRGRETKR